MIEERLKIKEAQLAEREIDLLQRELNVMILQQQGGSVPTPKKRKGNFKKSRLKLLKNKDVHQSSSAMISAPLGNYTIRVSIRMLIGQGHLQSWKRRLFAKPTFPFFYSISSPQRAEKITN